MLTDYELSAMVAEYVYRYKVCCKHNCEGCDDLVYDEHYTTGPMFATDQGLALDAALKVAAAKDPSRKWSVVIQPSGDKWRALIMGDEDFIAIGSTPARAMDFAALRASGVKVEDDGGGE